MTQPRTSAVPHRRNQAVQPPLIAAILGGDAMARRHQPAPGIARTRARDWGGRVCGWWLQPKEKHMNFHQRMQLRDQPLPRTLPQEQPVNFIRWRDEWRAE